MEDFSKHFDICSKIMDHISEDYDAETIFGKMAERDKLVVISTNGTIEKVTYIYEIGKRLNNDLLEIWNSLPGSSIQL